MAVAEIKDVATLAGQLNSPAYAKRSEGSMRETAQSEYRDLLKSRLNAARNTYESGTEALRRQQGNLNDRYAQQYAIATAANQQAAANAQARATQRGMQYSRTNGALLQHAADVGEKSIAQIAAREADTQANINSQMELLSQQLAESEAQANQEYSQNLINRIQSLKEQDTERALSGTEKENSLLIQLYKLAQQENAGFGGGGGGGDYGGGSSGKRRSKKPKGKGDGGDGDATSVVEDLAGDFGLGSTPFGTSEINEIIANAFK